MHVPLVGDGKPESPVVTKTCLVFIPINEADKVVMVHEQLIIVLWVKVEMSLSEGEPSSAPPVERVYLNLSYLRTIFLFQTPRCVLDDKAGVVSAVGPINTCDLILGEQVNKIHKLPGLNFLQDRLLNRRGHERIVERIPRVVSRLDRRHTCCGCYCSCSCGTVRYWGRCSGGQRSREGALRGSLMVLELRLVLRVHVNLGIIVVGVGWRWWSVLTGAVLVARPFASLVGWLLAMFLVLLAGGMATFSRVLVR